MPNAILFKFLVHDQTCREIQVISKSLESARITYQTKVKDGHLLQIIDAKIASNSDFGRRETAEYLIDRNVK